MARLYLLLPVVVVVVGLASMWHALVTLEGVASLTDTPAVIGSDQPLPTTIRYVRIEGAALDESSVFEVRVTRTERSGRERLDHTYFASTWQRRGERLQAHTNAAPRASTQLLGVYHPAERGAVSSAGRRDSPSRRTIGASSGASTSAAASLRTRPTAGRS